MRWWHGGGTYTLPDTGTDPPPDPDPESGVEFAWTGNVTDDSATIKAASEEASVTLYRSTNSDLSGASTVSGSEGADNIWTFDLTGLSAATEYFYGFAADTPFGRFRTFPTEGSEVDVLIAAASCAGNGPSFPGTTANTSNATTFDSIRARDPHVFLHMGDRHYRNISTNDVSLYRTAYRDVIANERQRNLHLNIPVAYLYDDHDFGGDNSGGNYVGKAAAQQAYREHVPHWDLPADSRMGGDGEIYQTFVIGRIRLILLDTRSSRDPSNATNNSSKTKIGADHKAWFKDLLLAATEPVIVVDIRDPWIGSASGMWSSYPHERQELAEFFEDNSLTERLVLVAGDKHFLAGDDGTHTQHDPGSSNPGPVLVVAAPLDAGNAAATGTYTTGIVNNSKRMYATLDFADESDTITGTFTGYSVSTSGVDTQRWQFSKVFAG